MNYKITIEEKFGHKSTKEIECDDYFLIVSDFKDRNGFMIEGITYKSSSISGPRQMGWLWWTLEKLKYRAGKIWEVEFADKEKLREKLRTTGLNYEELKKL